MFAGIDLGSRTANLVVMKDGRVVDSVIENSGRNPVSICKGLLANREITALTVTGYGRHLAGEKLGARVISEIKAYSMGASKTFPDCRTIIDVGGQDCKIISLDSNGILRTFEMNDRCAAGTGRFLEIMAGIIDLPLEEFGRHALKATGGGKISSTCTVFAESEVISYINNGADSRSVARGIHEGIATRIAQMAERVGVTNPVVFAGGGAKNIGLVRLLEERLGSRLLIPKEPQLVGALGAAIEAEGYWERNGRRQ